MLVRQEVGHDVETQLALPHPVDRRDIDTDLESGVTSSLAEGGELLAWNDDHILTMREVPGHALECIQQSTDDITLGSLARFWFVDDLAVFGFSFDLGLDCCLCSGSVIGWGICGWRIGDASGSDVLTGAAFAGFLETFALLALLFFAAGGLGAHRLISPAMILSCRVRIPCIRLCGPGGQPGT